MIKQIIKRPVLVSMLLAGMCLLGAVSYKQLPVEFQPFIEPPFLIVQTGTVRDVDPSYVEEHGIIPIEQAIAVLDDVDNIESFIDRRRAMTMVYYKSGTNLKYAYLKLSEALREAEGSLEDGFFINVWKVDTEQLSNQFMTLQALGEGSLDQIREVVDTKVLGELEKIDGIANIEVYGGTTRSVSVILDEAAMKAHDLTASQVRSRIAQGNSSRQFLGSVIDGNKQTFVNLADDYTSVDRIGETIVKEAGPVLLKHIARIIDGGAEETSIARVNGLEAVRMVLVREQQANLLELSKNSRERIEQINELIAHTKVELAVQTDASDVIDESIGVITNLALVGSLLAVLVLWAFLRNLRLVLVVAAALPLSVIIAMNFFYAAGITINSLSLMGVAIAIGMLLDNSIVVLENIHRQMSRGLTPHEAVLTGTSEVSRSIVAATLTTICVFLPFVYSSNFLTQILGRNIGIAIISTLLVSLAVAFLLIPAFANFFLSRKTITTKSFSRVSQKNRMMQIYTLLLKSCLRYPARTTVMAVIAFFGSILIALAVSINVSEELEEVQFPLYATMPSGTTLEIADNQVIEMDKRMAEFKEIEERLVSITEDDITFTIKLVEDYPDVEGRDLNGLKDQILEDLETAFPRVDFSYQQPLGDARYGGSGRGGGGGGGGRGEAGLFRMLGIGTGNEMVVLRGQDLAQLQGLADDIQFNLNSLGTISRTNISIGSQQQELHLLFDWAALHHFDISANTIISELSSFQSEMSTGVSINYGDERIDVILTQENLEEKKSDDLRKLQIPSGTGGTVPISELAQLVYTAGNSNVNRVDQEKQVEVVYHFERDITGTKELLDNARDEIEQIVNDITVPDGISVEIIHDENDLTEYYFLIFASMILIYMILASVFESLLAPLAMMFTLPLASVGALWGLILTGNTLFSANSMMGILILLGVIVNNGIILIDYSRLLQARGFRRTRAMLTAGQTRVRPILITAATTILAMLPLAMGKAAYVTTMGAPFAITVIGGMIVGTLFTLLLIPTAAYGLENALIWWKQLTGRVKIMQFIALAGGIFMIHQNIDALLWQVADGAALMMIVPAMTYFIQTSLRRSSADLIDRDGPINIKINNVVKNYDGFSRFVREWRKADRQKNRNRETTVAPDNADLMWRLPLLAFHFYFAYLYLEGTFWITIMTAGFYMNLVSLLPRILPMTKQGTVGKLIRTSYQLVYWLLPAGNMLWYYLRWDDIGLIILPAMIWYPLVIIYASARRLHRTKMKVSRITGRLSRLRRLWYRMVLAIPVVGKQKKTFRALNQVSMEIGNGMFGLVGPNGAGKTTLMRIICGILKQNRGTVEINGIDINEKREELQALIGYLPQEFGTYENMSARSFLDYQALLKGLWDHEHRQETVDRAIAAVHLGEAKDRRIKAFSGGMRQRVGIAQTLLHLPKILVVDEPTAGLDPKERIRFRNLLTDLARDRVVIFSTHIIEDVSSSCNRLAVMDQGEVQFLGSPQELVELTEGRVWQVEISEEQFEIIRTKLKVVHHLNDQGTIRVRILAAEKPLENAIAVRPTLEDSYLWLLKDNKNSGSFQEETNGTVA